MESLAGTDIRRLDRTVIRDPIGICVADLSFISLRLVLPTLKPLLSRGSYLLVLVKPQFEAGREKVGRGGIVRDEAVRQAVLDDIAGFTTDLGFAIIGTMPSPIAGGDGNREFLLGARYG